MVTILGMGGDGTLAQLFNNKEVKKNHWACVLGNYEALMVTKVFLKSHGAKRNLKVKKLLIIFCLLFNISKGLCIGEEAIIFVMDGKGL
ncbi:hypothetical protein CR513_55994, partial [Mucuna pruriens]